MNIFSSAKALGKGYWKRFKKWGKSNAITVAGLALLLFAVLSFLLSRRPGQVIQDYGANLTTELLSIAVTVIILDRLYAWRQEEETKARLTRDLLSRVTDSAVRAVDELRHHGWLDDVLQGVKDRLAGAHLEGANLRGAHLEEADLVAAHLEKANLMAAHLEGANLRGAHLEEADLVAAYLEEADLGDAHLEGTILARAHLKEANLRGAHLKEANLRGTHLEEADLVAAHLEGTNLERANLKEATLWIAHLKEANLVTAHLEEADLRYANLERANLTAAHLEGANLEGANLKEANLEGANLEEANFERANLERANLERANLERANLERANLKEAKLVIANLKEANLRGAHLEEADLVIAHLEGTNLERANLEGTINIVAEELASVANLQGATMPDGIKLRDEGKPDWRIREAYLEGPTFEEWLDGQRQLPPEQRAIYIDENDIETLQQEQPGAEESRSLASSVDGQAQKLRERVMEVAYLTRSHPNGVYARLRKRFAVSSYKDLTQAQYPAALTFLEELQNGSS